MTTMLLAISNQEAVIRVLRRDYGNGLLFAPRKARIMHLPQTRDRCKPISDMQERLPIILTIYMASAQ